MATGTPFHPRTAACNRSLDWREWAGYFAAGRYNSFHQPEYAAIRNATAMIDVSPLYKYWLEGPDAVALADRVFTRSARACKVGQVIYTPWCNDDGNVLQEGTLVRHAPDVFQLNAAEPALRWLRWNAQGLDVAIHDRSTAFAALSLQGPTSRDVLCQVIDGPIAELGFFRLAHGTIDGTPVFVTRTGYTGDLGYELWLPADQAVWIWDRLLDAGRPYGITPCGLKAMDVSRIEAGFVLIGVDYVSAERAKIPSQLSSPFELALDWTVNLRKRADFVGRRALARKKKTGSPWQLVGLEVEWQPLEALYARAGLMPDLPTEAWREAVPVYSGGKQVGRATSGCWSTLLKKQIALASVESAYVDLPLAMEVTVDHQRKQVPARVAKLPFFRPDRMRA